MSEPGHKRRILLASVLKPVDEPRMFERIGQSLAANGYDIFIAGFPSIGTKPMTAIHFLPHEKFERISFARIKVRFKILAKAFSLRPDVFIISSHELIGIAMLYRVFTGRKIIYDVQENYWRNIMYTDVWPKFFRSVIAFFVRLKEVITAPFFGNYFLAEKCYESELRFTKGKSIVIENKCKVPTGFQRTPTPDANQLIFTGTIAVSTGIFEAIELAKRLHQADPKIRLTIIGHCAQPDVLQKMESEISKVKFITLIGGKDFVPHERIMQAIASAHFGLVFYPSSPHTENKIPSKLYEYLACGLPIVLQDHEPWAKMCRSYPAAIPIHFHQPDIKMVLERMKENNFYTLPAADVAWSSEEAKLIRAIQKVLV